MRGKELSYGGDASMINWDAVGAVAELAGAMAVVATLGYLALQIRQNSRLASAANPPRRP